MNGGLLNTLGAKVFSVFGALTLVFATIYVFSQSASDTANLANKTTHALSVGFFAVTGSLGEIGEARDEVKPYVADPADSRN